MPQISENADYGDVVAPDTLLKYLQLEQSFDRHLHKWPLLGHRLGYLLRLHLKVIVPMLERIGVPLPEPAGMAWVAVGLDA